MVFYETSVVADFRELLPESRVQESPGKGHQPAGETAAFSPALDQVFPRVSDSAEITFYLPVDPGIFPDHAQVPADKTFPVAGKAVFVTPADHHQRLGDKIHIQAIDDHAHGKFIILGLPETAVKPAKTQEIRFSHHQALAHQLC